MSGPTGSKTVWMLRSLGVILAVSLLVMVISAAGWMDSFTTAGLDSFIRILPAPQPEYVVIVDVDDEDYEQLFGATSPLDVDTLKEIVRATMLGRPAVMALDFDTDIERVAAVDPPVRVPVVWIATDFSETSGPVPRGLARMPRDSDGIVRRHKRWFTDPATDLQHPSFAWAIVRQFCESVRAALPPPAARQCAAALSPEAELPQSMILNFSGNRYPFLRIHARDLLRAAEGRGWAENGPLTGKIVLIGGTFSAGRDLHVTSGGALFGVEIIAHAIESELQGHGILTTGGWLLLLVEIIAGLIVVVLFLTLSTRAAVLTTVLVLPLVAFVCSVLVFYSLAYWANFVPILISVLVHQLYETATHDAP